MYSIENLPPVSIRFKKTCPLAGDGGSELTVAGCPAGAEAEGALVEAGVRALACGEAGAGGHVGVRTMRGCPGDGVLFGVHLLPVGLLYADMIDAGETCEGRK